MKIGRNAPCPCGSGKKYKKCCLRKEAEAAPSQALYYRRLSEAFDRLMDRLVPFAVRTFGEDAAGAAMLEFLLWPDPDAALDEEFLDRTETLFWPWFGFNWQYDSRDADIELHGPEGRTVAELYAESRGKRLDPLERILIEHINRKPYSFYEVLQVDGGKTIQLQDVLTGRRIEVQERWGSQYVHPGDLLFGRAVSVDGVGMLIGLNPFIIPIGHKPGIIRLRQRIRRHWSPVTEAALGDYDLEMREIYFHIERSLHSLPQLVNTDGDPLEFHRLIYEVPSAEEAFEKLCTLCVTAKPEELRADADLDDTGRIKRIEFQWDRRGYRGRPELNNTVLGRIVIDGQRLTAEVNSAERVQKLRRLITRRLGRKARFRADEIRDVESLKRRYEAGEFDPKHDKEHEELMQLPEVREQLTEMICRHWESWIDQKIPALGNKTPQQAVKSKDGREAVEALLRDAERDRGEDTLTIEANRKGTRRVRELLGLKGAK
jgi:hypothetical protein